MERIRLSILTLKNNQRIEADRLMNLRLPYYLNCLKRNHILSIIKKVGDYGVKESIFKRRYFFSYTDIINISDFWKKFVLKILKVYKLSS